MNINSKDFSFRKGESKDISQLETCRINSIKNCKIYSQKQINIWINSKPNWEELIPNTIASIKEDFILGFIVSSDKFLDYLYVESEYQRHGLGDKLVSLVETPNMKCDCNPYSEKILIKRGWKFLSENIKEKSGERFNNKWYLFE
jgi:GNAT superfamily N-acetyltransferase